MKKIRMKVLEPFSRNLDGQIVTGDPKHPDEDGRFVHVSEAAAAALETAKLAKPYSLKDEAREEVLGEDDGKHEEDEDEDEDEEHVPDVAATSAAGAGGADTAQKVREKRTDTSGAGKGGRRRAPAKKGAPKPGDKGGAPVGGNDTNASTNHGTTSTDASGQTEGTNAGANDAPDADAAPTT